MYSLQATPHELLMGAFQATVAAVKADALLPPHLPSPPKGRLIVAAFGKAAADMAAWVECHWPEDARLTGLAITRHGHGATTQRIRVVEAGHPLPDANGLVAAKELLDLVRGASQEDHVLALISGGGSSLITLPMEGLSLADVQATVHALLRSGAPIADINCVRKHLSLTLGGRLAQACTAPVTALLLSDVTGDDPSVIASGPFSPDVTTFADALAILDGWRVITPTAIRRHLQLGAAGAFADTPKPGAPCFAQIDTRLLGNGGTALSGAAAYARERGITPLMMGDHFTGEARDLARTFAASVREISAHKTPDAPSVMLLSGGEAQVTVRGQGRGGRNGEFLLALALHLQGMEDVYALAADTDGIDGSGDNAGALLTPNTLVRAGALGLNAQTRLNDNDAYGFFSALGDLVVTGPTRTNANDFRAILIA